jgi:hypothetical protein
MSISVRRAASVPPATYVAVSLVLVGAAGVDACDADPGQRFAVLVQDARDPKMISARRY